MQNKNILLSSLKESLLAICRNKRLAALLLLSQVIFLSFSFAVSNKYLPAIDDDAKAISDYLSEQSFDEMAIAGNILQQKNILGDDPLLISRHFDGILGSFRIYLIYMFILLVVSISLLWPLSFRMFRKESIKEFGKKFLKMLAISSIYFGIIFLAFFSALNISITGAAFEGSKLLMKYVPFFILSFVLLYLFFISAALVYKIRMQDIAMATLKIGFKKAHHILAVYFINFLFVIIPFFLMAYFVDKNFFIVFLSLVLFIFSFVFNRIFMVSVVDKLENLH